MLFLTASCLVRDAGDKARFTGLLLKRTEAGVLVDCVQHAHESESEGDAKQKRHRRDGGRRNGGPDELEDGEVGEDGEIQ